MKIARPEKFEAAPDAILFGFDNALYAREPAHAAAWKAVRDKVRGAYSIPLAEFDRAAGDTGRAAAARDRLVQFHRAIETMGMGSRIPIALDLEQTYRRIFMAHAAPFDGVREFLDDVRLSNLPPRSWRISPRGSSSGRYCIGSWTVTSIAWSPGRRRNSTSRRRTPRRSNWSWKNSEPPAESYGRSAATPRGTSRGRGMASAP